MKTLYVNCHHGNESHGHAYALQKRINTPKGDNNMFEDVPPNMNDIVSKLKSNEFDSVVMYARGVDGVNLGDNVNHTKDDLYSSDRLFLKEIRKINPTIPVINLHIGDIEESEKLSIQREDPNTKVLDVFEMSLDNFENTATKFIEDRHRQNNLPPSRSKS